MVFVAVVRANDLAKKDRIGKGDPYIVLRFAGNEEKTKALSGSDPCWDNAHFNLHGNASTLYVMHKDKDMGADSVVSFCAVDLNKLDEVVNGWFPLFNMKEERKGRILLNIGKNGKPSGLPNEREYDSFMDEEIKTVVTKINKSAKMKDGIMGAAGGLLGGIGAGLIGKKIYDDNQKDNKEEEERIRREEDEKHQQQNLNTGDEERRQEQQQYANQSNHSQGGASQQGSNAGSGSNWDGNFVQYKTGQQVEFNNEKYRVLQSHASQNDWAPNVAHSLFERV
eukprot:NODE_301_length_11418_cov_0.342521.p3 type:complete len:281 gc:universal NODE_301_length_11418_cov_0.342521:5943-6785(+)